MNAFNKILVASCLSTLCSCVGNVSSSFESSNENPSANLSDTSSEEEFVIDNKANVILLFGQSNMEGESYRIHLEKNVSKYKFLEYQNGYKDILISYHIPWNPAQQSKGHFLPVALGQGGQDDRFGPEVGMAEYLHHNNYEDVYFVKYAYGGTSLRKNWRSPSSGGQVGELYLGAVEYVMSAMTKLEEMGLYPEIQAICWMQGESDADGASVSQYDGSYYDLQKKFMEDLRNEFVYYGNPKGIGFIDAGISSCSYWKFSEQLNADKERLAQESELNRYFSTSDLEYKNEPSYGADDAHYDSVSEIILGNRFAQYVAEFLDR